MQKDYFGAMIATYFDVDYEVVAARLRARCPHMLQARAQLKAATFWDRLMSPVRKG